MADKEIIVVDAALIEDIPQYDSLFRWFRQKTSLTVRCLHLTEAFATVLFCKRRSGWI